MDEWLTIAEVEKETGIPERTIRRYLRQHGSYISIRKHHRSYLVARSALPMLTRIRNYYSAGWGAEKVEEALLKSGLPVTITVAENGGHAVVTVAEALVELRRAVAEAMTAVAAEQKRMAQELEGLRAELAAARELLVRQEEERRIAEAERERLLERRDRQLLEEVRRILQERKKPWWRFW